MIESSQLRLQTLAKSTTSLSIIWQNVKVKATGLVNYVSHGITAVHWTKACISSLGKTHIESS